ncbi:MAG: PqqD family protein [bacterium]
MNEKKQFRINEPHVISELMEGEVIILNFDNGTYYSLNKSGIMIWEGLQQGLSSDNILAILSASYQADEATLSKDLEGLLDRLIDEELVVPADNQASADSAPISASQSSLDYEKPDLQKHTDLQELLLLDPIHDVDEMGWPNQPE